MWSCGQHAGTAGLTASDSRGAGKPLGIGVVSASVSPIAACTVTATLPARTASSTPQVRKISIVRVLTPVARGKIVVLGWRSTTSTPAPCRAAARAVARPAGPAPTTRTS